MTQLNIHVNPSFKRDLNKFMKLRHIATKSEAIRIAIKEGILRSETHLKPVDFANWLGLAKQVPVNKKAKFSSDDDLWG